MRPPGQRLFCDPYAVAFLRPGLRVLAQAARMRFLRWFAVGLYDTVAGPGPRPSAVARTRMIDDEVAAAMGERGHGQCVLLGAGFDTRAHRLQALTGCRVFEVDHPATQAVKRAVVERLGLGSRDVTRVGEPWTFGLLPDEAAGFLAERGFQVREDVSTYDVSRVWFTGRSRRDQGSRLYRIAVTELVGAAAGSG